MKREALYSSSERSRAFRRRPSEGEPDRPGSASDEHQPITVPSGDVPSRDGHAFEWARRVSRRWERPLLILTGGLVVLLIVLLHGTVQSGPPAFTQRDIDLAVLHTLENRPRGPSAESEAYQVIAPSVVRVERIGPDHDSNGEEREGNEEWRGDVDGLGTGVVVVEDGTILTNLHVVAGVNRLQVVFADGTESPADLVSVRPDQDLAVIRAHVLPDDLIPATLRSTQDLRMGDRVVAVGFPFAIGPSLTSGIVSGLAREYRNPEGERVLSNLIQFDAAANPGNSGGPLVTEDGHVVGIVTAILNPNNQRVFVGIGFAVPIESAMEAVGSSPF